MSHQGWMLGAMTRDGGAFRFVDVRALEDGEYERIVGAMARLSNASGHTLTGGLNGSLNDFLSFVAEIANTPTIGVTSAAFRRQLNSRLSAWLTAFSAFRAELEQYVQHFPLPFDSAVPENFRRMYSGHPAYRLTWQLRNLDQHQPPVGPRLSINTSLDPDTGDPIVRLTVRPVDLCDEEVARGQRTRQWEECRDLWAEQSGEVDVRWVFKEASKACDVITATYVSEREYLLIQDIDLLGRLHSEASDVGSPSIYLVIRSEDRSSLNFQYQPIDPLVFGEAIVTIDGARRVLGRDAIDWETDPRIGA